MAKVGDAFVDVHGDLSSLQKSLAAAFAPGKLSGLAKKGGIAIGAGLAAAGIGKGLFDLGGDFDRQFDRIRSQTGATGKQLKGLEGDFKDVLKGVPANFDQTGIAVAGLNQRLGLTGKPLQKLSKQILELSRLTQTDVGENVAAVTRLFGDWSVSTGQQSGQLDKLFRVSQKSGIGISELARLMVQFGSPLRQLGFNFDTAAAMFARFEREGVNIQTIMPGFRFALKNLAAPTGEAAAALKELGISAKDPKVALQEVFKAIKDAPNAMKANAIAFAIFGRRAGPDMAAAIREGRFELDELMAQMRDGKDTIEGVGKETQDFDESWQRLKNRVFVAIEPIASKFFDSIGEGMQGLADFDFDKLGDDLSKLGGDVGLGDIDLGLGDVDLGLGDTFAGVDQDLTKIKNGLTAFSQALVTAFGPGVREAVAGFGQALKGSLQVVAGTLKVLAGLLTLDFAKSWEGVKQIFSGGMKAAIGTLRLAFSPLTGAVKVLAGAISKPFSAAWDAVKGIFRSGLGAVKAVMEARAAVFRAVARMAGRGVLAGFDVLKELASKVRGFLGDAVGAVRGFIGRFASGGLSLGKALVRGIGNAFKSAGGFAADIGKSLKDWINRNTLFGNKVKIDPPGPGSISFTLPALAKGGIAKGLALVGEEGVELAKLPTGKQTLLGQQGPELRELPVGTRVFSHPETKRKLASISQKVIQRLVPAVIGSPQPLVQQVVQETLGTNQGKGLVGASLSRGLGSLKKAGIQGFAKGGTVQPSTVSQIVRTPDRKFVLIDKAGKAIQVADSAKTIPVQVTTPIVDLSAIESPKIRTSVQEAVKRHREPGGDAVKGSTRAARTSQLAGVSVTPNEVTAITNKWGVNRAVASIGAAVKDKFPGMNIISGYFGRENATTRSGSRSNHAIRAALDLGSKGSLNRRIGTWTRQNFPNSLRGVTEGVLDIDHDPNPPDHDDHVHVAALGSQALAKVMESIGGDGPGEKPKAKLRHKGKFSLGQMVSLAKRAGFPDPALAAAIGYAESRGNTAAHNTKGEDSRGLWQINVDAHKKYEDWDLSDAFRNVKAAYEVSGGGKNFTPWTMFTNKQYKQYLGAKGAPLPKTTSKGVPSGSSKAEYLAMKLTEAEGTKSDKKDDIRWINRALRYYRGVYRRNKKIGNFSRATEALSEIASLRDKKKGLRETEEDPALWTLGDLSFIGTGPNKFAIGGMQGTMDQIDLEKARATLTVPADTDDSLGALKASLQDDIAAAQKGASIWESLNTLVNGFRLPDRPLTGPFNPTPAQTRALNQTKGQPERIALLKSFITEATQGPFIQGTIGQKIEAATNLGTARSEHKSLLDEIGQGALGVVNDRLRAKAALAALTPGTGDDIAVARETVAVNQAELDQAKASGDNTKIADAAESLKSALDNLNSLIGARSQDSNNFLGAITDLIKGFGGNLGPLKSFAGGGPVPGAIGKPVDVTAHGGEFIVDPRSGGTVDMQSFIEQLVKALKQDGPGQVIKNIDARSYFKEVPADPHSYSRAVAHELDAAV